MDTNLSTDLDTNLSVIDTYLKNDVNLGDLAAMDHSIITTPDPLDAQPREKISPRVPPPSDLMGASAIEL